MSQSKLHPEYLRQKALQEALLARKNHKSDWYNGIYDRWDYPVLTREHIPLEWRFDLAPASNPYFMERLGVNAVFNAGAIELDGKFYLVARVEGNDRKSFFAVAESSSPVDGFRFWDKPVELPDTCPEETNVYDMRLTKHEDGWIYGVFCSESKDTSNPDLSAAAARQADIDLFVLDDGWFKGRSDTTSSLGDWTADRNKLPDGLPELCARLNDMDMELGLWVEPEAVSPDSDLYRAHPDWALAVPGRRPVQIRHQYTLDLSRPDVVDGIWQQLEQVLRSCPIRYLKWDMNRALADVYSTALPAARQGEVYHRYVLGLYELQRRLAETFPDLLLENCAGGGARFDCGMLYYSPQIWCSDNTDARARLTIQYGTSLFYPGCVVGAHFSAVPNHCSGHVSTIEARMAAALSGTFGFELDLTACTPEELETLRPYVAWYREHGGLVRSGDLYRLCPPNPGSLGAAWMIAAPDGNEAAVFAVGDVLGGAHGRPVHTCAPAGRLCPGP